MIDIHIVCAHDAVKLAEMLMRLLEAEEHQVRLTFGRQALHDLGKPPSTRDAVVLIWSPNARSQSYMIEWARRIEPSQLIEIAQGASDWPAIKRAAAVIDFSKWRGQRGARCWRGLSERLAAIDRINTPPKPPLRALGAMGAASLAAVSGAVVFQLRAPEPLEPAMPLTEDVAGADASAGIGGPLRAMEPASMDDELLRVRHFSDLAMIEAAPAEPLAELPQTGSFELRDPTLLERLNAYNPLRRDDEPDR